MAVEDIIVQDPHPIEKWAAILWHELTTPNEDKGGRIAIVTGEQGSGKTTLLRRLAEIYLDHDMFVIWRGREVEQIHWIPDFKDRCVFWHWDRDEFKAYDVRGSVAADITDELDVRNYMDTPDLLNHLVRDKINVIYEPTTFYFNKKLKMTDALAKSTGISRKKLKYMLRKPHSGELIWFELIYLLVTRLNTYWYAVLLDEADDIFPESSQDVRWRLQEWAKNAMRDLRKSRTMFIMSTHALSDLDYRIRSKVQYMIWMKNAKVSDSKVKPEVVRKLKTGEFIIECGYFGLGRVAPYKRPKMGDLRIVLTEREDEEDESVLDEDL